MKKQTKLYTTSKKTTTQGIVGSNFTKYLEESKTEKEQRNLFKFMIRNFIIDVGVSHIMVDDYINFYKQVPLRLFATRPILYFRKGKFDAIGMLGERVHEYTLKSKTLELYYKDCIGIKLVNVLDNEEPIFMSIKNPKDRLLESLYYLKENASDVELKLAFIKAKQILDGRFY